LHDTDVAHLAQTRADFVPDFIAGDLDSARGDVLAYYTSLGVPALDLSADQVR
jgi:thiamine pyrophosphokinase